MKQSSTTPPVWRRILPILLMFAVVLLLGGASFGQLPDRIAANFSSTETAPLKGSLHPLARAEFDQGRVSAGTKVPYMTLVFSPSAAQQAALTALLAAQQNPASASYHKWLTPAQYAAQFGMSSDDIATTTAWLQAQGFVVLDVANGRNAIHFSGTAGQVEAAFHTEMHQYLVDGTTHLANSTVLTLPSALAGAVSGIRGVAQFRPHAMHTQMRRGTASTVKPMYTDTSGNHYLAPNDVATIYDIKALYNAGYTGTGENIAIVGQSTVSNTDLNAFRSAAGLAAKLPEELLVPNTGAATADEDDEGESDLDLEWSGAIAQNATIHFLYAGIDGDVFDALTYAIQNDVAPIVSLSYGECEPNAGSDPQTFEPLFMQANTQGQTVLVASGDEGATGCDYGNNVITSATQGYAVGYPASSPFVTGMGGTEFDEGTTSYWNATNDSGGGSAISYIPEAAWNETATSDAMSPPGGLSSTGGGKSILFTKPSWQVATGVPADGVRDVPDLALNAAAIHDPMLYCTGDYCTNGFLYSDGTLTYAGGTSFDAPIFAGMLALIEQKNASTGEGNINPNLYTLYGTNPTAFHDVTIGNNEQPCTSGSTDCPTGTTELGYTAGVGYDLTTGLGSVDAFNLASVFPAASTVTTAPLLISTTVLTPSTYSPTSGSSVILTATVTAAAATAAPTGTVEFAVNGVNAGSGTLTPVSGGTTASTATYTLAYTTGTDVVTATYTGSGTIATSTSASITIPSSPPSFKIAATNVTVASGASADTTVTLTSVNAYAGTVNFTYTSSSGFTGCLFGNSSLTANANASVTATVTVDTLVSDCLSTGKRNVIPRVATLRAASTNPGQSGLPGRYPIAAAAMLAGLAMLGWKRKSWPMVMVLMLAGLGTMATLSGCGSSGSGGGGGTVGTPAGTYTITLTGTDSTTSSITATTTFTVTVQ